MTEITISLAQFDAGVGRSDDNLATAATWVKEAARRGSALVLLPELWHHGLAYDRARALATPLDGGTFAQMARIAAETGVWLAGSGFEAADGGVFNTLAVYSSDGALAGAYRKVHLFGPMGEDVQLRAGDRLVALDLPWGTLGLSICYDLRFPELFRRLALGGARVIVVPAQWPLARLEHWRTLAAARAIENQVFVLACNRAGSDGPTRFAGHSAVIDPWGEQLVEAGLEPALLTMRLDLDAVERARRRIPVWSSRRPDLYASHEDVPAGDVPAGEVI